MVLRMCLLELHALSNLPPLPIKLFIPWREGDGQKQLLWWQERNPVLFLLWNCVQLSELQVGMQNESDFLKSLIIIIFFSPCDSCVFRAKMFEGYIKMHLRDVRCLTGDTYYCCWGHMRPRASPFPLTPFLQADISLELSFSSQGGRVSKWRQIGTNIYYEVLSALHVG